MPALERQAARVRLDGRSQPQAPARPGAVRDGQFRRPGLLRRLRRRELSRGRGSARARAGRHRPPGQEFLHRIVPRPGREAGVARADRCVFAHERRYRRTLPHESRRPHPLPADRRSRVARRRHPARPEAGRPRHPGEGRGGVGESGGHEAARPEPEGRDDAARTRLRRRRHGRRGRSGGDAVQARATRSTTPATSPGPARTASCSSSTSASSAGSRSRWTSRRRPRFRSPRSPRGKRTSTA